MIDRWIGPGEGRSRESAVGNTQTVYLVRLSSHRAGHA